MGLSDDERSILAYLEQLRRDDRLADTALTTAHDALLVAGLVVLPMGLIALGVAMLGSPAFGKGFGGASAALGVVGGVAACVGLVDPASPLLAVGIVALIVFHLVLGWKVCSLSRNPAGILEDRGYPGNGVRAEGDFNSPEPINAVQQGGDTP